MRLLALAMLALSGCSLIRTTMPEPVATWAKRSDCNNQSSAPLVVDAVAAGIGAVGVGGGAIFIAQGTNASGDSTVGTGAATLVTGIAVVGLFLTSAIIGVRRTGACNDGLAAWDAEHPDDPDRPRPGEERVHVLARAYLACPAGELVTEEVSFGRNNKWADDYRWGRFQISGCGKMTWCGERDIGLRCEAPPDLQLAAQQLSVESGCAAPAIRQLQRFAAVGHQGRDELVGQATYRLDACGQQYSCSVPLYAPYDNETPVPVLREGGGLLCKPGGVAPLAPPPPSP